MGSGRGHKFGYIGKDSGNLKAPSLPQGSMGNFLAKRRKAVSEYPATPVVWNTARKTHFSPAAPRLAN